MTSKFTSFVAIEKRDEGETFDSTSALNVDEILDGESVDILGYIDWLEDSEDEAEVGSYVTKGPSTRCDKSYATVILTYENDC